MAVYRFMPGVCTSGEAQSEKILRQASHTVLMWEWVLTAGKKDERVTSCSSGRFVAKLLVS
jgi:hypothetical protein